MQVFQVYFCNFNDLLQNIPQRNTNEAYYIPIDNPSVYKIIAIVFCYAANQEKLISYKMNRIWI